MVKATRKAECQRGHLMTIRFLNLPGYCLTALLALTAAGGASDKPPKLTNLQGKIHLIDKDNSTITVDTKNGSRRLIVYRPETKIRYGHSSKGKESSWEQVHETNYISCAGTYDEKMRLVASECVHRESR